MNKKTNATTNLQNITLEVQPLSLINNAPCDTTSSQNPESKPILTKPCSTRMNILPQSNIVNENEFKVTDGNEISLNSGNPELKSLQLSTMEDTKQNAVEAINMEFPQTSTHTDRC